MLPAAAVAVVLVLSIAPSALGKRESESVRYSTQVTAVKNDSPAAGSDTISGVVSSKNAACAAGRSVVLSGDLLGPTGSKPTHVGSAVTGADGSFTIPAGDLYGPMIYSVAAGLKRLPKARNRKRVCSAGFRTLP